LGAAHHRCRHGYLAPFSEHPVFGSNAGVPQSDHPFARAGALIAGPGFDSWRTVAARRQSDDGVAAAHGAARLRYPVVRDRLYSVPAAGSAGLSRGVAGALQARRDTLWVAVLQSIRTREAILCPRF